MQSPDDVEACLFCPLGCGLEGLNDSGDAFFVQGLGCGEFFS